MEKEKEIHLDPIYKWTGGKRKEIKTFKKYYPNFVKNSNDYKLVEPFFGGGAVYWSLNANENVINDIDTELVNFLNEVKNNSKEVINIVNNIGDNLSKITQLEKSKAISISEAKTQRGVFYYEWRNKDRKGGLSNLTPTDRAARFYIVNQLAFNGMRRFNSSGEFNIPYGNYKQLNISLTNEHLSLLKKTKISCGSYKDVMLENDTENTFIYLDPPYTREFNEYSHENVFGNKEQIELCETFKSIKNAKVMIIINKDEFTESLYKEYIKHEYDLKYATNIKNRYNTSVTHLVITNY
jgi:DNA adenine methylase